MGYDLGSNSDKQISTLAKSFHRHSAFELIGGVDINSTRREIFENKFKCPTYDSINIAFENNKPDIVVIAVSTYSHFSVFMEVINTFMPKAILCEKPLSNKSEEAEKMVRFSTQKGIQLFTNYLRRCDQGVIEIRRRIVSKEIKPPVKGVCWYSKGLLHNGSHFLNLFQYWLGDVDKVKIIDPGLKTDSDDIEPDVKIFFELGEVCFLSVPEENFTHCTCELIAENGRLRYEHDEFLWYQVVKDKNYSDYSVLNNSAEKIFSDSLRMQWHVADQLAQSLSGEYSSICTGAEGLSTLNEFNKIAEQLT